VPAALALLMLGRLSNHLGRRAVSLFALASAVIGLLVLTRVDGAGPLLLGRAFQGLGTGIAMSAIGSYIVDLDPPNHAGVPGRVATAVNTGGVVGGVAIGGIVSGALVEYATDPRRLIYFIFSVALAMCAVGIVLSPETSPRLPGATVSLVPAVRIPPNVRVLFVGASAIFIACWALGSFYQSLAPSLSAVELGHSGSLFAGFAVASFMGPGAIGGLFSTRLRPRTAMIAGSTILVLAVIGVLIAVATKSSPGFFVTSVTAGLGFGTAFHGGMRLLMTGLATIDRAGLLSGIYLFSYLGAAIPALIAGQLVNTWGLSTVTRSFGGLIVGMAILAMAVVTVIERKQRALAPQASLPSPRARLLGGGAMPLGDAMVQTLRSNSDVL
jgi:MFS family permease